MASADYRKSGAKEAAELDPFERWMVQSNVTHLEEYGGLEATCARLSARGYDRVSRAVRRTVEQQEFGVAR